MKWNKKIPVKDGAFLTYNSKNGTLGMMIRSGGKWYVKLNQGVFNVPVPDDIDYFTRITLPDANSKVHKSK